MLWLRGLVQSHLDLRFSPAAGVETRVVDRPGLWMAPDALAALVDDARAVARETLPDGDLHYGVLGGDPERLKATVLTVVYDSATKAPIAFNALAWMPMTLRGRPIDVLHMGLVMVSPKARSQGLSWILYGLTCFLLFARGGMRPVWISNVTQVPAVVGMVTESFAQVYPTPDEAPQTFEHLFIARQIMRDHRHVFGVGPEAGFDETHFVITNAYTGGSDDLKKTFDQAAKHRQEKYNALCANILDYARGDDFLQIGQVTLAAARRFFTRSSGGVSPLGVSLKFGLLALEGLVAPVIQWFAADTPMGDLRPARGTTRKARRATGE